MSEEKKPIGRPSKYKEEYAQALIEHFDHPPYRKIIKTITPKNGEPYNIEVDEPTDFPTLASFACKIGVCRDTLQEWAKHHEDFSAAYKRAILYQEQYLTVNGLKGFINSPFGIFTAKNVLKWRDKQPDETDVVVNNLSNLSDEELDARIEAHLESKK